mmetsp:Transcript_29645/g.96565  ORF Transcript_29645/g.96565 Transcript_29645/m.96565 type:complete len:258 (-) Transcript_29645:181-954(-)
MHGQRRCSDDLDGDADDFGEFSEDPHGDGKVVHFELSAHGVEVVVRRGGAAGPSVETVEVDAPADLGRVEHCEPARERLGHLRVALRSLRVCVALVPPVRVRRLQAQVRPQPPPVRHKVWAQHCPVLSIHLVSHLIDEMVAHFVAGALVQEERGGGGGVGLAHRRSRPGDSGVAFDRAHELLEVVVVAKVKGGTRADVRLEPARGGAVEADDGVVRVNLIPSPAPEHNARVSNHRTRTEPPSHILHLQPRNRALRES